LSKGEIFGEKSILLDSKRTMDVIAKSVCIVFSISVETLQVILGQNFRDILYMNLIKLAFKTSPMINKFEGSLIDKAFTGFRVKDYEKDQVVIPKGHKMNQTISIIIEGNLIKVE
jgi:hypothetical protein